MEYLLLFIFLPTILHLITGEARRKVNKVSISIIDEIVDSLDEQSKTKGK